MSIILSIIGLYFLGGIITVMLCAYLDIIADNATYPQDVGSIFLAVISWVGVIICLWRLAYLITFKKIKEIEKWKKK